MSGDQVLNGIKIIGTLILSWPVVVILLVLIFRKELETFFFKLPDIFSTSKIKIGNILEIQKNVEDIGKDVDTLKFLILNLFTKPEVSHLNKLNSSEDFTINISNPKDKGVFFGTFRDEIAHLYNSNFITQHKDSQGIELFDEDGSVERRVQNHCEITPTGKKFLRLYYKHSDLSPLSDNRNA